MNPPIDELEDWLEATLPKSRRNCLLDIGAYRGDFSLGCKDRGLCQTAHLFEPNPKNQIILESLIQKNPEFTLHNLALSDTTGESEFQCSEDCATGSLLNYQKADNLNLTTFTVKHLPLDDWWKNQDCPQVGLVKVDTQGHDLNVLKGGCELIRRHRPWLIIEIIFVPLYSNQTSLTGVLQWAESQGYHFGNLFNDHFTNQGLIAFSDLVLIPTEDMPKSIEGFPARPSPKLLQHEIKQLHQICAERLELIERLDSEAKRLTRLVSEHNPPPSSTS